MENEQFNFILSKLSEALSRNDKKYYESLLYLIRAMNDQTLNNIAKRLSPTKIDEEYILKLFNKESLLRKKAIIAGLTALYLNEHETIEPNNNWDNLYSDVSDLITDEDGEIPKDYAVLSKYINEKKTNFYHYVCASLSNKIRENCLIMLKGWSSSTPLINSPRFRNQKFGGGFYLRYNGVGFAIDPGCNFVENMHEQGIYISDIDYVIITHSHIDHNSDMETIATLNYEYNKIISDRSFQKFNHIKPHKITWYVDTSTYAKFETIDSENIYPNNQHIKYKLGFRRNISARKTIIDTPITTIIDEKENTKIEINYFPTVHKCPGSFGFKMNLFDKLNPLNKISIGYTSDTAYFDKLSNKLEGCDILIANMSELSKNDLEKKTIQTDVHLRLQGCINLIEKMELIPKLYIISEFWGGKEDIRLYIAKTLIDKINNTTFKSSSESSKTSVIVGDVGLTINLNSLNTKCSFCNNYAPTISINTILTGQYERLKYSCGNCYVHN